MVWPLMSSFGICAVACSCGFLSVPRPLAFTLITQAGYAIRENVAQTIQQQLRAVGIDVRVELHDGTALSAIWFEGRFEAMLHWWQMPSDPELTTLAFIEAEISSSDVRSDASLRWLSRFRNEPGYSQRRS